MKSNAKERTEKHEHGNEAAFAAPEAGTESFSTSQFQKGLTKREYFAAMVISGKDGNPEHIAEHAIMVADELIKLLNNGASGE